LNSFLAGHGHYCLQLSKRAAMPSPVVVVDDGSTDATRQWPSAPASVRLPGQPGPHRPPGTRASKTAPGGTWFLDAGSTLTHKPTCAAAKMKKAAFTVSGAHDKVLETRTMWSKRKKTEVSKDHYWHLLQRELYSYDCCRAVSAVGVP